MIKFCDVPIENIKEHNPNQPEIPDHPYIILIIGDSGFRKTRTLLNLSNCTADIDKICLYTKDSYGAKYQCLINKENSTALKNFNDSKAFIQYSNNMDNIYKNIEECNPNEKRKIFIIFYDILLICVVVKKLVHC